MITHQRTAVKIRVPDRLSLQYCTCRCELIRQYYVDIDQRQCLLLVLVWLGHLLPPHLLFKFRVRSCKIKNQDCVIVIGTVSWKKWINVCFVCVKSMMGCHCINTKPSILLLIYTFIVLLFWWFYFYFIIFLLPQWRIFIDQQLAK